MEDTDFYRTLTAGKGASFDDTNWFVVREAGDLPALHRSRPVLMRVTVR